MPTDQELYDELAFYTLSHPDPAFIHQHIVDAYAAQCANDKSKPIQIVFALIGLYLHLEKGFTGKQVQRMHMRLARQRKSWPTFTPPGSVASITVRDVMAATPGEERDRKIDEWCTSVWQIWQPHRDQIVSFTTSELDIS